MKRIGGLVVIAITACGGAKATDDLQPKSGGYSAVGEEKMSDAPADNAAANGQLDGADYLIDGESVLKDLRLALLHCDPVDHPKTFVPGTVTIAIEVGSEGKVLSAVPEARSGLTDDIELCLRRVAMGAELAALPAGKTATFKIPLQFTRSALKRAH